MFPFLASPVAFSPIAKDTFNVFAADAFIGQVRKAGYGWEARGKTGLLIRETCKTRAHASLWLVRAAEQVEAPGEQA